MDSTANGWALHDRCGISHDISMSNLGSLDLPKLDAFGDISYYWSGWPPGLSDKDLALGRQYGFDPHKCVADDLDEKFVRFGEITDVDLLRKLGEGLLPDFSDVKLDCAAFSSFFAHLHDDIGNAECRGQVNIILQNPAGHRLLSVDSSGKHHVCTPEAGQAIFLDIHCQHAIMPNQSTDIQSMVENPMKAIIVSIADSSPFD